mgnify:CR=1 FL=1|tara:strand:+ start:1080 stop:1580 length:501 start_codon:yes stop_codon:yes gene_type:complete
MFRIKLLILSLVSLFLISCSKNNSSLNQNKYSIAYIGGEYNGLILENILRSHLQSSNLYDISSAYQINASVGHSGSLFVTNIDNTSDRERVDTSVQLIIFNKLYDCNIYTFGETVSQFYIMASNDKFISNEKAIEKIRYENTDILVRKFINNLKYVDLKNCSKEDE